MAISKQRIKKLEKMVRAEKKEELSLSLLYDGTEEEQWRQDLLLRELIIDNDPHGAIEQLEEIISIYKTDGELDEELEPRLKDIFSLIISGIEKCDVKEWDDVEISEILNRDMEAVLMRPEEDELLKRWRAINKYYNNEHL